MESGECRKRIITQTVIRHYPLSTINYQLLSGVKNRKIKISLICLISIYRIDNLESFQWGLDRLDWVLIFDAVNLTVAVLQLLNSGMFYVTVLSEPNSTIP
ncbi:MAG: hypothetical protein LBE12_21035 [Planctomycetaceae bacterium]|nr:hypothetical protein [Planctomycetaceae bacterium]